MTRILVTGSRRWTDHLVVWDALSEIAATYNHNGLIVVHGGCPTGADQFASQWARHHRRSGVREEPHLADWATHGRSAGPIRNRAMVASGAAVCLAFPLGRSAGTRDCMRVARVAGIPVKEYTP